MAAKAPRVRVPRLGNHDGAKRTEVVETSTGLKITVKQIDPMFLQAVVTSVKMPPHPTYEVTTVSGRTEVHRLDAKGAGQIEGGLEAWATYQEERAAAEALQNERTMKAMFLMGTECDLPSDGWEKKWRFLDIHVPTDPDERRAFYLASELPAEDSIKLMSAIMRITGVDEGVVQQAEDAFRSEVREGDE